MKRFMQMLLASFGVMALLLAGCNGEDTPEGDDDTPTEEGDDMPSEDAE